MRGGDGRVRVISEDRGFLRVAAPVGGNLWSAVNTPEWDVTLDVEVSSCLAVGTSSSVETTLVGGRLCSVPSYPLITTWGPKRFSDNLKVSQLFLVLHACRPCSVALVLLMCLELSVSSRKARSQSETSDLSFNPDLHPRNRASLARIQC